MKVYKESRDDALARSLRRAGEFEAKGKYNDAIKELEKIARSKPNDGNLYNRLGDLYVRNNNIDKAIFAFTKGVKAYRTDNFSRNAIALCKKILRYDPSNVDIYSTIGELLVELDEKSDALIYYFVYIEKQLAQGNKNEVLKALDAVTNLGTLDGKKVKKVHESYKAIGRHDLAKKFLDEVMKDEVLLEEIQIPEPVPVSKTVTPKKTPEFIVTTKPVALSEEEEVMLKEDITRLDTSVKDIEAAITELRKAMRLDEVILALDKSMTAMSSEQKKAIALLQTSVSRNLDKLHESVIGLREGSDKSATGLEHQLSNLSRALTSLSNNQATFTNRVSDNLESVSATFSASSKTTVAEIKGIMSSYRQTADNMCSELQESKTTTTSLLHTTEGMRNTVQKMSDSVLAMKDTLVKFILAQESKEKKLNRFIYIIIAIMSVMCGFLIISAFK